MASPTTTITSTCACKTFTLTIDFPTFSLPLSRALCLCNSCRSNSGSCGNSYITLPSSQPISPSKWNLSSYATSPKSTRYFCSTCGAHVLVHRTQVGEWAAATGLWDRTEGIVNWTGSKWVEDTMDGGVSSWLNDITDGDGKKMELRSWKGPDGDNPLIEPGSLRESPDVQSREGSEDKLKASCHCGGVKFYITRPSEASKTVQSPYPDLITPYHSESPANPNNEAWWVRNDTKYLAGTCACTSCRLALGFEIQTWAFVPKCNIFREDGTGLTYEMGTLKQYPSRDGVWREFCGVCGATAFWHCEERPELVDVSVGLLDPAHGARVEGWLDWWTQRVSFEELAVSKSLIESLSDGMKTWGDERKVK